MEKTACTCWHCGKEVVDMLEVSRDVEEYSRKEKRKVVDHCCPHCKTVLASDDQITGFIKVKE